MDYLSFTIGFNWITKANHSSEQYDFPQLEQVLNLEWLPMFVLLALHLWSCHRFSQYWLSHSWLMDCARSFSIYPHMDIRYFKRHCVAWCLYYLKCFWITLFAKIAAGYWSWPIHCFYFQSHELASENHYYYLLLPRHHSKKMYWDLGQIYR